MLVWLLVIISLPISIQINLLGAPVHKLIKILKPLIKFRTQSVQCSSMGSQTVTSINSLSYKHRQNLIPSSEQFVILSRLVNSDMGPMNHNGDGATSESFGTIRTQHRRHRPMNLGSRFRTSGHHITQDQVDSHPSLTDPFKTLLLGSELGTVDKQLVSWSNYGWTEFMFGGLCRFCKLRDGYWFLNSDLMSVKINHNRSVKE